MDISEIAVPYPPMKADDITAIRPDFASIDKLSSILNGLSDIVHFDMPLVVERQFGQILYLLNSEANRPMSMSHLPPAKFSELAEAVRMVQEGLAAAYYHLENVRSFEKQITAKVGEDLSRLDIDINVVYPNGFSMATLHSLRKLKFEYQAFRFALRRALEYFSRSVAVVFLLQRPKSVRKLASNLRDCKAMHEAKDDLVITIEAGLSKLGDVLPPDDKKSVRDRLAHDADVPAGVLHVFCGADKTIQITLVGGGEQLQPPPYACVPDDPRSLFRTIADTALARVLLDQVVRVQRVMFDAYARLNLPPNPSC